MQEENVKYRNFVIITKVVMVNWPNFLTHRVGLTCV